MQRRLERREANRGRTNTGSGYFFGMLGGRPSASALRARGVYLGATTAANPEFLDATFDRLEALGGNAFVVDVKGSNVYFPTTAAIAHELGLVRPVLDLADVVSKAHARGIYVIGRFISLKDPLFSARRPDAHIRHPSTGRSIGTVWVDGSMPVTLEYNQQVLRDLLLTGIDEVNLDYIRYPTEYAQASIGLSGKEKADRIEPFIRMVRETIDEVSPGTVFGISTYAILGWNYPINLEAIGQDFVRFAPYVDVISPMAYPSTFAAGAYYVPGKNPGSRSYYLVWRTLDGYKQLLGEEHWRKLRPWIQGYYVSARDLRDQMAAVQDAGLCGYTVWNARNDYTPAYGAMKDLPPWPEECAGR